jgi:hypothetical protein
MTNLQNIELARSIERHRHDPVEHLNPSPTVLQRVTAVLNAWSDRRDRS